jgi:eukaryotic-like serine/threonine-protein kinase
MPWSCGVQSVDPVSSPILKGQSIARFRILERIGAGGMGEVFRATDEVLQRPVALKVLSPELVHDQDRVRRFVREAQSASALNHPNIMTVYDVGMVMVDGDTGSPQAVHYIAMELIEGETIGEYIKRGEPLQTVLEFVQQVADALSKAHAIGILHRDLKPDNIMVTAEGRAKVVDFGLAKLIQPLQSSSPTRTLNQTREGVIRGTVGYMSPEQVTGSVVDGRSDIFSLGCVLYQAITRTRPFEGVDAIDTLHKIQHDPHSRPSLIDPTLPASLDRIVGRCLAKDPDERYQTMSELAVELRLLVRDFQSDSMETVQSGREQLSGRRVAGIAAAIAILGITLSVLWIAGSRNPGMDLSSYRFTPLQTLPEYEGSPAFSADGRGIAYIAEVNGVMQVFVRDLDSSGGVQLTQSLEDCAAPFWSPDGREIYYISIAGDGDALWAVNAAGGASRVVLENVVAAALSPDGRRLAFLRDPDESGGSLFRLWLASPPAAEPRLVAGHDLGDRTFLAGTLRFSPDGSTLGAWLTSSATGLPREFWLIDPEKLKSRRVLPSLSAVPSPYPFAWLPDSRRIIFSGVHGSDQTRGTHLWMADTKTDRVRALTASSGSETSPTISPDGSRIVFVQEDIEFDLARIPLDEPRFQPLLSTSRGERDPAWSPSGTGFSYVTNRSGIDEIWFRSREGDWERPIATQKEFDDDAPTAAITGSAFSPDGQRLAYLRRGGQVRIWVSPVGGGRALPIGPELFSQGLKFGSPTWSPDASSIAFVHFTNGRGRLARIPVELNSEPLFLLNEVTAPHTRWSPDGRWLTAETEEGLFLVSPDGETKRSVSDQHWLVHAWSLDSSALYGIRIDDELHLIFSRLPVEGTEQVLANLGLSPPVIIPLDGFSLSPDGKEFIAGTLQPVGDLWMLEGFEVRPPWWRRLKPFSR